MSANTKQIAFVTLITTAILSSVMFFYIKNINAIVVTEQDLSYAQTKPECSISADVATPGGTSEFKEGSTVNLKGSYIYGCSNSSSISYEWYLDYATNPDVVATTQDFELPALPTGFHELKYKVTIDGVSATSFLQINIVK